MNTIENLYLGNIDVLERGFPPNLKYVKLKNKALESSERLTEKLTPEEKDLFINFTDTHNELESYNYIEHFCIGFRLGVKLMVDVYTVDDGVIYDPDND